MYRKKLRDAQLMVVAILDAYSSRMQPPKEAPTSFTIMYRF